MATSDRTSAAQPSRSLRSVDLLAIGLNATVGSGVFLLPDDLYRQMGAWSPLAFVLCAFGLLPVAWCFADAATRTRASGGPYEYTRQEFGEGVGYSVGWMCFSNAVFSFAAVARAAAAYAARLVPALDHNAGLIAFSVLCITAFGVLNYVGAKPGAWAIRAFTVGKFAVLILLSLVLLPELQPARLQTAGDGVSGWTGVSSAVFMALFALQGFEVVGVVAGEAEAPERRVPRAVLATLFCAAGLYVVVQAVLLFGFDGLGSPSDAPLADAALSISPSLGIVVALGALISTLGFVSGSALGTPRYLFAMAAQRHLPSILSRLHPVFQTPHISIVAACGAAALLVLPLDYRTLIGMSNVAVAVQYGATCAAVLRRGLVRKERATPEVTRQSATPEVTQERATPEVTRQGLRTIVALFGVAFSLLIWGAATMEELLFAAFALLFGWSLRFFAARAAWAER